MARYYVIAMSYGPSHFQAGDSFKGLRRATGRYGQLHVVVTTEKFWELYLVSAEFYPESYVNSKTVELSGGKRTHIAKLSLSEIGVIISRACSSSDTSFESSWCC